MAAQGSEAQIAAALMARLASLTLSPALPVAYPDVAFTKPTSGMWLETALFPAPTEAITVAHDGINSHTGFLQVTVVSPQNQGAVKVQEVVAKIIQHFKRGAKMADGATTVQIVQPPYASPTFKDEPYTRTPVTVRYQAFARQS